MKKAKKIMLAIILVGIYLNIGWALGAYYHDNVFNTPEAQLTTLGKIAAGGFNWLANETRRENSRLTDCIMMSILWPLIVLLVLVVWIICGAYYGAYYSLWFLGAGGIAKLLGLA